MNQLQQGLDYVHNTNGGGTRASFVEDFEPVGEMLWRELHECGLVEERPDGSIRLTAHGKVIRGRS